jgi:uncharacterized UPF0160 family protein
LHILQSKEGDNIELKKELKKIGTHDGRFHADEVMATAVLKEVFQVELTRTRDEKVLDKLDIVYDVGGGRFDHHGVEKVYREDKIPYAASGLIWKEFGRQAVKYKEPSLNEEEVEAVSQFIDRNLIEGIDALDNGIWIDTTELPLMNISTIISGFNPNWKSEKNEDEAFNEAVRVAFSVLDNTIDKRISVLKAKDIVAKAYNNRKTKELLILNKYCPYVESLRELDENEEVLFVIYPRKDSYAMQTVRKEDREDKKKLPAAWAGKRDEELAEITGVKDAIFCHTGRFIAVAGSFNGIMKLAKQAVDEPEEKSSNGIIDFIKKIIKGHSI